MQTLTPNHQAASQSATTAPLFVMEIMFANGKHGIENVNDVYIGSADISDIINFPYPERYYPLLDAGKITGISQSVDAINGVSTIGNITATVIDTNNYFSDIVQAADTAGHGLKRQLCQMYRLERGLDWADRLKIATMHVSGLRLNQDGSSYALTIADTQHTIRMTVCQPFQTALGADVPLGDTASGGVQVLTATNLQMVTSAHYGTVGFIKINSEIMRYTAVTGNILTVGAADRGLFGTVEKTHKMSDQVDEIIVMRGNPIVLALKMLTSTGAGTNGAWDSWPKHWGIGLDAALDINTPEWLQVGQQIVGLDTLAESDGMQFEFVIDKSFEAKAWIEKEILQHIGAFGFVHGDGRYGIKAYNDLGNIDKAAADRHLTIDDCVSWSALNYDYTKIVNSIDLQYDRWPKYGGKFIRRTYFRDQVSIDKWGRSKTLKLNTEGLVPMVISASALYQRNHLWMSRYSRPPLRIDVELLPRHFDLEIGDIVRLTLPMRDLLTGADMDRAYEVLSEGINTAAGTPRFSLVAQPEKVTLWTGEEVNPPLLAASAFHVGTQINWDGLGGAQVVSVNTGLPAGDWWVNGAFTVALGVTLTISANTRLFVDGDFTVDGTIYGVGNGLPGAARAYSPDIATPSDAYFNKAIFSVARNATTSGWVGKGGQGGLLWSRYGDTSLGLFTFVPASNWVGVARGVRATTAVPILNSMPSTINAFPGGVDGTGAWTSIQGLPPLLAGGGGGSGVPVRHTAPGHYGGAGGAGGAGLLVVARAVYVTIGTIDLTGGVAEVGGASAAWNYEYYGTWLDTGNSGGGGGGGGGSCVLLAERDAYGLPNLVVDTARVHTDGGAGAAGDPTRNYYDDDIPAYIGLTGSRGALITQVIG